MDTHAARTSFALLLCLLLLGCQAEPGAETPEPEEPTITLMQDGVRPDVRAFIREEYGDSPELERHLVDVAQEMQFSVDWNASDREALLASAQRSLIAANCVDLSDPQRSIRALGQIEELTANTPERIRSRLRAMAALDGTVWQVPLDDELRELCSRTDHGEE